MTERYNQGDAIGNDELQAFVRKLDAWATALPLGEKALLQLVLERAAGREIRSGEDADLEFPASGGFGEVVTPFLREIVSSGALSVRPPDVGSERMRTVRGWVEAGDPWVQGA